MIDDIILYRKATSRVKRKKKFYKHTLIMSIFSILLLTLTFIIAPGANSWVFIPVGIFGLSVFIHYLIVFKFSKIQDKLQNWEEDKLEIEYMKLKELKQKNKLLRDEEILRLNQLEKEYRDEDFV